MKNDPKYIQGIPDLTLIYKDTYVMLECKRRSNSNKQANQGHYVNQIKEMGGRAYFIYPDNLEEVLDEISRDLGTT